MTDPMIDRRNLLTAGAMMTVGSSALLSTGAPRRRRRRPRCPGGLSHRSP
ncbi:hypothetical protein PX699_00020 [Sphingobium sp. H39-3-25]|nr:hypothetical protein [Sphingobium arseniciresistens]